MSVGTGLTQNGAFAYDDLLAGDAPVTTKAVTVEDGQTLVKGSVIGLILRKLASTPSTYSGTGNGVMSGEALKVNTQIGDYSVECIEAIGAGGRFKVLDPNGNRLDDFIIGTAYANNELGFDIADGSTDFIVGDTFTIHIEADAGKANIVDSTKVDGTNVAYGVLLAAVTASGSDLQGSAALTGEFKEDKLTFGGTDTKATHRDAMRDLNMQLIPSFTEGGV